MKTLTSHTPEVFAGSYQPETQEAMRKLSAMCPRTVAESCAKWGMQNADPLLLMMDSVIRYAKAYRARFDQTMGEDHMARDEIAGILKGIRGLLNFDGGVKMEADGRTLPDSKDNGMLEDLYWKACEIAGIDGDH